MATGSGHTVLDHLRRVALRQRDAGLTDGELLTRYLARRDEAAFEALVRRHGPMVLGVCRRVLRCEADVEDAFQATFLVLVRKAASVVPREKVANFLYGVAYHTALKARDAAVRRRVKERQAGEMHRPEAGVEEWRQLLPLLDQELHRLPDKYRVPIVLCDLEGKTHKEAARQLGWPQGTLSGRLSRARVRLARRLARHGPAPSGGALASALASANVPATLTTATVKAAATGVISTKVIALVEGVSKAMLLTKLKALTSVLLAVVLAGIGTAVAVGAMPGKEVRAPVDPAEKAAPEKKAVPEEPPPDPDEKAIREFVETLRAAVRKPADDHHVYRLVIEPTFRKAVHWAARRGDDALVVELLKDYCGPNNPDNGGTSLTWAAWFNDAEAVKILLDRGVKVNGRNDQGRSALHEAVRWGPELTKLLLGKGADVNARSNDGATPLMLAAEGEQPEIVRLLLAKDADVNARDDDGRTALMRAAASGRLDNAKALLAEGANVRLKDKKGRTARDVVQQANDFLPGFVTDEDLKDYAKKALEDAEALRALLERAGGKE